MQSSKLLSHKSIDINKFIDSKTHNRCVLNVAGFNHVYTLKLHHSEERA